jgi:hypothetical protein
MLMYNTAYSALLDFVLATFPFVIIYKLQMSKKEKLGVIFAMSLGVLYLFPLPPSLTPY